VTVSTTGDVAAPATQAKPRFDVRKGFPLKPEKTAAEAVPSPKAALSGIRKQVDTATKDVASSVDKAVKSLTPKPAGPKHAKKTGSPAHAAG
jgi:hypothetical protein